MDKSNEINSAKAYAGICHCCGTYSGSPSNEITRRKFVQVAGTTAIGTVAMPAITWASLSASPQLEAGAPKRNPLIVSFLCFIDYILFQN